MRTALRLLTCFFCMAMLGVGKAQEPTFEVVSGMTTIQFDRNRLKQLGVDLNAITTSDVAANSEAYAFVIPPTKPRAVIEIHDSKIKLTGALGHVGGFALAARERVLNVQDFAVSIDDRQYHGNITLTGGVTQGAVLWFPLDQARITSDKRYFSTTAVPLYLADQAVIILGTPNARNQQIGSILIEASISNKSPKARITAPSVGSQPAGGPTPDTGDLTFCQLNDLRQFGREGNTVGLAVSTTSWNIGKARLDWLPNPNFRHPFIVSNLYRLESGRIIQIGQSDVKHGFLALNRSQCGGTCGARPGQWLEKNCTDTYTAGTNATQTNLAPRHEINPWTGYWDSSTSHLAQSHSHPTKIDHLLQVAESDLPMNGDYVIESYYVHYQDPNVENNAAWKPVKITERTSDGTFVFDMTSEDVRPNIGFAIDAWTGAEKTVVAQQVPVIKGQSPDGRVVLAAKVTDLGNGTWRYDYAIENIDMDRQVGSFSVSISANLNPFDLFFQAPAHADTINAVGGTPIDNAAWNVTTTNAAVTWTTRTNPVMWGTLYNFGFTATHPSKQGSIKLGFFKQGTPTEITGTTLVPAD